MDFPQPIIDSVYRKSCDGDSRPAGTGQRAGEGGNPVQVAQNRRSLRSCPAENAAGSCAVGRDAIPALKGLI